MNDVDFEVPSRVGPCSTRDSEGCLWSFYYVNLKEVGRGGFGVVFSAQRSYFSPRPGTDGRNYAIKILRAPCRGQEAELDRRIRTEKAVHEHLKDSAHLVTPISFLNLEVSGRPLDLIVTEFCEGGDLLNAIRRRPTPRMDETEARTVIRQVCRGVEAIHNAGFIHRDIKEANIFITNKPGTQELVYKLGDFGLATELGQVNTTMCGTKTFMAPEVTGRTPYGPEVDVWSLGVLLYTLLVGRHPFKTANDFEAMSSEARDLVIKMLTRDPKARIRLSDVFNHPFIVGTKFNRTQDSGIVSSVGSMSIKSQNTAPFVPGLQCVTEEAKPWNSYNNGPVKAVSTHSILKTVAANMPSTFSTRSLPSKSQLCPPFSTHRLRPSSKKHQFKVGSGVICQNGSVKLEFNITKKVLQNGIQCTVSVLEEMSISSDGNGIQITRNGTSKEVKIYQHSNLPQKYWPKYNYAAKFVNIVRESTPKITFYTDKAMCRLMENGPPDANFEAHFYNGPKFVHSATKGIQVTDAKSRDVEQYSINTVGVERSNPYYFEWVDFKRYHERAIRLETQFETINKSDSSTGGIKEHFFPVTLGKRPASLSVMPPVSLNGISQSHQDLRRITKQPFLINGLCRTNSSPNSLSQSVFSSS